MNNKGDTEKIEDKKTIEVSKQVGEGDRKVVKLKWDRKVVKLEGIIEARQEINENRKRRRSEDRTVEQIEKRSKNREKQAEAENKGYNKGKIDLDNRTEWTIDPDNREVKTDSKTTIDVPDNRNDSRSVKTIDRI